MQLTNDIAAIFNYALPVGDNRMVRLRKILEELVEGVRERAPNKQSTPCSCGRSAVIHLCSKCFRDETTPVADYNDPQ